MEGDFVPVFAQVEGSADDVPAILIVLFIALLAVIMLGIIWFSSVRPFLRRRAGVRQLPHLALQRGLRYQAEADDELWTDVRRFYLLRSGSMPGWIPQFVRKLAGSGGRHVVDATWGRQPVRMFNYIYWERVHRSRGKYSATRHHRGAAIVRIPHGVPHFWLEPRGWLTRDHAPQSPLPEWERIKTGFDDFDRRFTVRSSRPEEARRVLVSPLTDTLLALPYGRWEVSQDGEALLVLAVKPWELGDYERVPELLASVTAALSRQVAGPQGELGTSSQD